MKTTKKMDEMNRGTNSPKNNSRNLMTDAEFKAFCQKRKERMHSAA